MKKEQIINEIWSSKGTCSKNLTYPMNLNLFKDPKLFIQIQYSSPSSVYMYAKMHNPYKSGEVGTSNNLYIVIKGHMLEKLKNALKKIPSYKI